MTDRDRVQLLFGLYQAPPVKRGDRAFGFVRDSEVVITGWSDAPMSWPRGYARSEKPGGGPALLVDDELARAVRRESAAAVCHWWGVGHTTCDDSGLELLYPEIETHHAVINRLKAAYAG